MKINIEDLVEGVTLQQIDIAPDTLSLPTDEGDFSSPIHIDVTLTKTGDSLLLQAIISTDVQFPCSRCLIDFNERISCQVDVLYEKSEGSTKDEIDMDLSDDVEILDFGAKEIDIGRRMEEAICLSMPFKPLCREECRGLCGKCGTDLNKASCDCKSESVDSRWEALKEILE